MREELLPLGKQTNKTLGRTELKDSNLKKTRRKHRKDREMLWIRKHHKMEDGTEMYCNTKNSNPITVLTQIIYE